jgi:hypothetical protein
MVKQIVKVTALIVLAAIASPIFILNGCGEAVNGKQCGGCPDSTAPFGSTIVATDLSGAPSASFGGCYPAVTFQVLSPDGEPLNDICVELFTDGAIAKDTGQPDCSDVIASPKSSMITRTNSSGVVMVEFLVPPSTAGTTFFVEAVSCSVSAIAVTPASN